MLITNVTQVGGNGWKYPFYQKMYLGTLKNPWEGNDTGVIKVCQCDKDFRYLKIKASIVHSFNNK